MARDDPHPSFAALFERSAEYAVDEGAIRRALADRRADGGSAREGERNGGGEEDASGGDEGRDGGDAHGGAIGEDPMKGGATGTDDRPEPSPARVVADAGVLAADLLVGDASRDALDLLWRHSWTTIVASDPLLDDAAAVIASVADRPLARDWRSALGAWREPVDHPDGDHPALASAYRAGAMQIISQDPSLTGTSAAVALRDRLPVSVREPRAFATVFSPERLYPETVGGTYPGPDREPRR